MAAFVQLYLSRRFCSTQCKCLPKTCCKDKIKDFSKNDFHKNGESETLEKTDTFNPPSRFLREIPKDLIDEIRPRAQTNIPYNRKDFKETKMEFEEEIGIALGQKVQHKKFGEGIVLNYEGSGESARVQVNFDSSGTKWLVMAYANLEKI